MSEASDDLQQVRSRICDLVLAAFAVFAIPAVTASVSRSVNIGWQWFMSGHIAAAVFIGFLLIFRKSLPYNVRAGSIVSIFLFFGLAGFWEFGMIAGANPLLLIAPVLATVLFGKRLGMAFAAAIVLTMVVTAYSFVYGGRVFKIDFDLYAPFIPAWITYMLTVVLAIATAIAAISMSNRHLSS